MLLRCPPSPFLHHPGTTESSLFSMTQSFRAWYDRRFHCRANFQRVFFCADNFQLDTRLVGEHFPSAYNKKLFFSPPFGNLCQTLRTASLLTDEVRPVWPLEQVGPLSPRIKVPSFALGNPPYAQTKWAGPCLLLMQCNNLFCRFCRPPSSFSSSKFFLVAVL